MALWAARLELQHRSKEWPQNQISSHNRRNLNQLRLPKTPQLSAFPRVSVKKKEAKKVYFKQFNYVREGKSKLEHFKLIVTPLYISYFPFFGQSKDTK